MPKNYKQKDGLKSQEELDLPPPHSEMLKWRLRLINVPPQKKSFYFFQLFFSLTCDHIFTLPPFCLMPADPLSNRNIDVGWKNINPKGQLSGVKMVASNNSSSPGVSSY